MLLLLSGSVVGDSEISPISNNRIVAFKYSKDEIRKVFTKQQTFLTGGSFPVKLVLFDSFSENQKKLCKYIDIAPLLLDQQLQRKDSSGSSVARVSTSADMVSHVSKYFGALGYLPEEDKLIFNNGTVVFLEIE